jgi:zinc protease
MAAAVCLLGFGLGAQAATPGGAAPQRGAPAGIAGLTPTASVEGITEYRLPNGLQLLMIPDASKPTTTVNMTYRVGSRFENYGETGMAHLLEHLLFKGSPRHPQVWSEFNQRGLRANGSTWYDRTNYFASFAANNDNLKWYLAWQADAMVHSFIARRDLDSEMTVVRNEMEMGENDPQNVLFEKTIAAMYQWHNYGKSTIGARSDVEGVDIARLQAFYRTYYQPDNATLIVSGKFEPAQVLGWVREFFGPIPKPQRALPRLYTQEPAQEGERSLVLRRVGGVPLLFAGYHVPAAADPDYAAIKALGVILADTPSGRLHKRLTEQHLAASVFSFTEGLYDPGFALFGAELGTQQDAGATRAALLATIESIQAEPITEQELQRAKAKWLKSWDLAFTDPQKVGVALSEVVAQGDWRLFFLTRDRVRDLKLADVQRVALAYLLSANRTLGEYQPTASPERAPQPKRPDVAAMLQGYQGQVASAQAEAFDTSPANIDARTRTFALSNGMKVALLAKATRGAAVHASLTLHFGDEKSLAGWGDAPAMLAALLDKGTTRLGREAVQDQLDELRTEVAVSSQPGAVTIDITSRREHFAQALALVGEMLRQPALAPAVLDEVRRQSLSTLEQQRKEPEAIVDNALGRYGNPYLAGDVRYARSFDEIGADLKAVTIERVKDFHARFYGANYAQFGAVGDFDEVQTRQALEAAFGAWSSASAYTRVPDPLVAVAGTQLEFRTPDKQNATLSIELPLPLTDRDDDYVPLMLANHLLGAGGDSRLWNRVREKDGLSYSVESSVQWNPYDANSTWLASAIFAPQNRAKVETAMSEEIARALAQGFTAAELGGGKRSLLNFRRLARAQDPRLAAGLVQNLHLGRTYAESARIDAAIDKVTLAQVNEALRRYIKPERFVWAVAGDFSASQADSTPAAQK